MHSILAQFDYQFLRCLVSEESPWLGVADWPGIFGAGTIWTKLATFARLLRLPLAPTPGVGMAPMLSIAEGAFRPGPPPLAPAAAWPPLL